MGFPNFKLVQRLQHGALTLRSPPVFFKWLYLRPVMGGVNLLAKRDLIEAQSSTLSHLACFAIPPFRRFMIHRPDYDQDIWFHLIFLRT